MDAPRIILRKKVNKKNISINTLIKWLFIFFNIQGLNEIGLDILSKNKTTTALDLSNNNIQVNNQIIN